MTAQHSKSANPSAPGAKAPSGQDKQAHSNGGQTWASFAMDNLPESIQAQSAAWFTGQAELVAGVQEMIAERVKRYQDAAAAAVQSFQRICGSQTGVDAYSAYQEWLAGSMNFFMADMTAMQEQATRMTQMNQRALHALSPAE